MGTPGALHVVAAGRVGSRLLGRCKLFWELLLWRIGGSIGWGGGRHVSWLSDGWHRCLVSNMLWISRLLLIHK